MPLWVTFKDGKVLKYNDATIFRDSYPWVRIGSSNEELDKNHLIAKHRIDQIDSFQFREPCETKFIPDVMIKNLAEMMIELSKELRKRRK